METIRYEDLLHAPARTIGRLAALVGVEVGVEEAGAIWDAVGLRAPEEHGGERRNGHGPTLKPPAWRRLLDGRQVEILRGLGYGALLGALGYDPAIDAGAVGPSRSASNGDLESGVGRDAAYHDFEYHALYGKPVDLQHQGLRYWSDPTLGLRMLTTDPDLCQLASIGLASRYFRVRLLASSAGGLAGEPRP